MNLEALDKAFSILIHQRGIHHQLESTSGQVYTLRYNLANNLPVSTDLKLKLLQKSGWKEEEQKYSREDLVSLPKCYERTIQAARDNGPEYVVEKWEKSKK